jgi:hypothetical protein
MNTIQFLMAIVNWLQADPSHLVVAASALAAITPTPNPATPWGRAYKVLELLAMNFLHAKETGTAPADIGKAMAQVAAILAKQQAPAAEPTPIVTNPQ